VLSQTLWLRYEVAAWQSRSAEQAAALDAANEENAKLRQQLDQLQAQPNRDAQETGPVADPPPRGDAAAVIADFYVKYPERPERRKFIPVTPYGP
jgi:soluble lytic murein transglycosylase-like protein